MNNRISNTMALLAAGLVTAVGTMQHAIAQERRLPPAVLGIVGSYDYGHVVFANVNREDLNHDPYANEAHSAQVGVTFIFPKIVANGFGLSSTISYGRYGFSADGTAEEDVVQPVGGSLLATTQRHYQYQSQALQMDLTIYGQIGDIARIEVGPWGGIGYLPSIYERQEILSPSNARFSDGSIVRSETHHTANTAVVNAGGVARVSLEVPIFGGMALAPFAQLRAGGVWVTDDDDAFGIVGMFGGGLGILFGQPNGKEIEAPPISAIDTAAPPVAPPPAPTPELEARVDLYSRDLSGRSRDTLTLAARRTLHRMEVPLNAELRFERNSAALPARYTGYSAATRDDFTLDAFADKGPAELHRQALNVIGMRLAAAPSASIVVTGMTLPDEPKWFGKARSEAVRQYLVETWGVGEGQVTSKEARASKKEGRAVVKIASVTPGILDPIATEWIEEEVNAAPIGIEPEISAPNGVKEWHASIRQGGREIGVVRDSDSSANGALSVSGLLANYSADGKVPSLTAELIVEDSSGATTVARDELTIVIAGELSAPGGIEKFDRSISRYILTGAPGENVEEMMRRIVDATGDGASITLRPLVGEGSRRIAADRLHHLSDRLRATFTERGKEQIAIGAGGEVVIAAREYDRGSDARSEALVEPVEITVVR